MEAFLSSIEPWLIYVVVAVLTFGESAAFLSLVFPGEIGLVAAAALGASAGVDPILLVMVATIGAVTGGLFGYSMGRRYGDRILAWGPISTRLGEKMMEMSPLIAGPEAGALVAVARFNQITRAVVPALAGMAGMRRVPFVTANTIGALLWAGVFTAIGHYAAEWWNSTSGLVHLIAAVVIVSASATWLLVRWRRRTIAPVEE